MYVCMFVCVCQMMEEELANLRQGKEQLARYE